MIYGILGDNTRIVDLLLYTCCILAQHSLLRRVVLNAHNLASDVVEGASGHGPQLQRQRPVQGRGAGLGWPEHN